MKKYIIPFLFAAVPVYAAVHDMTLPQALEIASRQNPDVALARLDEQRAQQGVKIAHDPFSPKLYAGSGLAYTYGYPNSIDGNAPSIIEVKTDMAIYNRPRSYQLAAAKEEARGAQIDAQAKADDVAYRTATLFLDAQQSDREAKAIEGQVPALQKVLETMETRVVEGVELPVEVKRAKANLAQAQLRIGSFRADEDYAEMLLAVTLGYSANDRIHPVEAQDALSLPPLSSDEEAVKTALNNSKELRRLQSAVLAKEMEIRSYKATRLPQINLVAQYSLFAKYNYQDYFPKVQRNNGQIGASFVIPLMVGSGASGQLQQTVTDISKLRIQIGETRNRITTDTRRSLQELKKATDARDLAKLQLDLAHDELSTLMARYAEGRGQLSDVEKARTAENERWLAFYDSDAQVERAKLGVLRQVGNLMSVLRAAAPTPDSVPGKVAP